VRAGRFRTRYNAVIIAIARNGERLPGKIGDIRLRPGDTLFLEARPAFIEQHRNSRDFFLVSEIGGARPPNHEKALTALAIVSGMVLSVALGWLDMLEAALVAAGLLIVSRCIGGRTARQAPDWQILVVIATSFGIGTALQKTGAATTIAGALIDTAGGNAVAALALVYLTTAAFTAVATNNVAAVIVFPIAVATAETLGVATLPFAIAIMVAASASFATPLGYQTNLMVFNVGGYRFADFLRAGLPLTLLVGAVTVLVVPLRWGWT
jgi:di/tricarboxylate transporter